MYFTGPHLRVITPITTNGMIPKIIDGEVQYKTTFLPLSAKRQMESKNNRLLKKGFKHLMAEIEVVSDGTPEPKRGKSKIN